MLKKVTRGPLLAKPAMRLASPLGIFPVSAPPRYQLPMSVSFPLSVSIATFGPTLETSLRKDPKYE